MLSNLIVTCIVFFFTGAAVALLVGLIEATHQKKFPSYVATIGLILLIFIPVYAGKYVLYNELERSCTTTGSFFTWGGKEYFCEAAPETPATKGEAL
jgi:ABC-type dipeptide/oligopeptide/nickel transport system permease component